MSANSHRLAIACLVAVLACTLPAEKAKADEEPNWYTVELLVFRYLEDTSGEQFPLLPELSYPDSLQALRDGKIFADGSQEFKLIRIEDMLPEASSAILSSSESDMPVEEQVDVPLVDSETEIAPSDPPPPEPDFTVPRAFALLPEDLKEFNDQRRALNRRRDTRALFHAAWRQPMQDKNSAVSIPIQNQATTDYPNLQGSVLLYASRYLHLETQLWLNEERQELPTEWTMPAPPLAPAESPAEDFSFSVSTNLEVATKDNTESAEPDLNSLEEILEEIDTSSFPARLDREGNRLAPFVESDFIATRNYDPFNHATLLQQKRRMRSGETHYLDHPRLGVLIKVTPYEFEPMWLPEGAEDPR